MHIGKSRRTPDFFWEQQLPCAEYQPRFFTDVKKEEYAYSKVSYYIEDEVYTVFSTIQGLDPHYKGWDKNVKEFITEFNQDNNFV